MAVLSHPTLDYFIVAAGILSLGAVIVNINWRQPEVGVQVGGGSVVLEEEEGC